MKRAFLVRQLLVLLAGFVAINGYIALRSAHYVPQLLLRSLAASPPVTDLCLGNSLMQSALNVPVYEHAAPGRRVLNAGLGSTSPVEHDLLLRRALHTHPAQIFYGFFDQQLNELPNANFSDLGGNRTISHFVERETAIRFLAPDRPLVAWRIRLVSWVPVAVERKTLWTKVELARRWLGGVGMPSVITNQFGRAEDFRQLESANNREFTQKCLRLTDHWPGFTPPVTDMLTLARAHGAKFCFVEMPMASAHRRFYATPEWAAYEQAIRQQAAHDGARFINAADWVSDDGFADPLHLNPQGAVVFSQRLAAAP